MQQVTQLKSIRDEALTRLQNNPDYKLMTSLDSLIIELEGVTALAELAEKSVTKETTSNVITSQKLKKDTQAIDEAFENLVTNKKTNGTGNSVVDLADEINGGAALS